MQSKNKGKPQSANKNVKKPVQLTWKDRITPNQYDQLKQIFQIFDQDNSGSIDPQQIVKALQQLGLSNKSPYVLNVIWALRQQNKILNFEQFMNVVCQKTGQCKSRDGIKKVFDLYDVQKTGQIGFDQLKQITRRIGQNMTDEDILEMMHSVFITKKTESNEKFNFQEFYQIITRKNNEV